MLKIKQLKEVLNVITQCLRRGGVQIIGTPGSNDYLTAGKVTVPSFFMREDEMALFNFQFQLLNRFFFDSCSAYIPEHLERLLPCTDFSETAISRLVLVDRNCF